MKTFGVIIEKGPMNWQVLQQKGGSADISLEGSVYLNPEYICLDSEKEHPLQVFVRLFDESDNRILKDGMKAEMEEDGHWRCIIKSVPAGGPYRIETCMWNDPGEQLLEWSTRGDIRHHICVGDVFFIAGQSNAVGYGRDFVYDPPELGIHMMRENGQWDLASHPLHDCTDTIFPVHLDGANPGHSPFLAFARTLKRIQKWPVGLIMGAKGGCMLERWNPMEDGRYYRNMLEMIRYQGGSVRAVLWCQGCGDTEYEETASSYKRRLKNVILQSRADLGDPLLPWFLLQINKTTSPAPESHTRWGTVREQQRQAAGEIPHVYLIPTIDGMPSDSIHNNCFSNIMIGERLAKAVAVELYGDRRQPLAPALISAAADSDRMCVVLTFTNVRGGLCSHSDQIIPFTILDQNGNELQIRRIEYGKNTITLSMAAPLPPEATAACLWQADAMGAALFDEASRIPVVPFYDVEIL